VISRFLPDFVWGPFAARGFAGPSRSNTERHLRVEESVPCLEVSMRNDIERADKRSRPWAMLGVIALLLLAGLMFYNLGGHGPDRTATTDMSQPAKQR
jgi:hypothetical protein